uniref:Ubiquinone biosynthesis O-methyltransferase, mitochondrial n=1 Tax=Scophthalmus maximus TaxID=52904 RepID=A0A8D3E8M6_SCOMX
VCFNYTLGSPASRTCRLGMFLTNAHVFHSVLFTSYYTICHRDVKAARVLERSREMWGFCNVKCLLLLVYLHRDNLLNVHGARHPGKPLAGLRLLDVGCGGGLLSEPLGRLGAHVLGIDPVSDSIHTAQLHASYDPDLCDSVSYRACTLEELSAEEEEEEEGSGHFDAIVASEVVEHLADLETFAFCCSHMLKPGGSLFVTTINKTNLSYALGIVVAEQLLRIVPSGTHDWEKFISPVELERLLESNGFSVQSVQGMLYNPASGAWSWTNSTAINYALHAVKLRDDPRRDPAEEDRGAAAHSSAPRD